MDFYRRVAIVCQSIPYGKAASYGQIALLCGKPNNSRQVGYALRKDLAGDVPAHRIVNGQGYLSGAAAFFQADTQRSMLKAEGVTVSADNRVDLKKFGWKTTLEDALAFRKQFEQENV